MATTTLFFIESVSSYVRHKTPQHVESRETIDNLCIVNVTPEPILQVITVLRYYGHILFRRKVTKPTINAPVWIMQ